MKALSIRMPWAYLIAKGIKDIENRSRPISYRGKILIHAGAKFDKDSLQWLIDHKEYMPEYVAWRIAWLIMTWNRGMIIGEVDIVDCVTNHSSPWFTGDYGYVLANPKLYADDSIFYKNRIIPYKGRLGLFEVPDDLLSLPSEYTGDKKE